MNTLHALPRESKTNLEALRASERVPAVVYGTGIVSTPLSVDKKDFIKLYREIGETSVLQLVVGSDTHNVLIHDIQLNPVNNFVIHVDFLRVDMNKKVTVSVPVVYVGEAPAEKMGLGVLVKALQEIEIEVLPNEIPHEFTVDVSGLETLEANIYARDIALPASAELVTEPDVIVATCTELRDDSAENSEINFDAIGVEKKGKKEE
jgi:large subunit ribosomal protein L25